MTTAKKILAVALVFGVGVVNGSAYRQGEKSEPVVENYTVQPGDTFWNITERYCDMDERRIYLLEYQDEVRTLNPTLKTNHCQLQPGDVINIRYYKE